jgi:hypothetical protein
LQVFWPAPPLHSQSPDTDLQKAHVSAFEILLQTPARFRNPGREKTVRAGKPCLRFYARPERLRRPAKALGAFGSTASSLEVEAKPCFEEGELTMASSELQNIGLAPLAKEAIFAVSGKIP